MSPPPQLLPFRKDERVEIERLIDLLLKIPSKRKLAPRKVEGLHTLLLVLKRLPMIIPGDMAELRVGAMHLTAGGVMFLLEEIPGLPPFAVCDYGGRDGDAAALHSLISRLELLIFDTSLEVSISDMSISKLELDGPSTFWHLLD